MRLPRYSSTFLILNSSFFLHHAPGIKKPPSLVRDEGQMPARGATLVPPRGECAESHRRRSAGTWSMGPPIPRSLVTEEWPAPSTSRMRFGAQLPDPFTTGAEAPFHPRRLSGTPALAVTRSVHSRSCMRLSLLYPPRQTVSRRKLHHKDTGDAAISVPAVSPWCQCVPDRVKATRPPAPGSRSCSARRPRDQCGGCGHGVAP